MTDDQLREMLAQEFAKANCPHAAARVRQSDGWITYPTDVGAVKAMRRAFEAGKEDQRAEWARKNNHYF